MDDLFQEGCVGLIRAAMAYDPHRDGDFAPFALQRIRGAVHDALSEHFATVRVPARSLRAMRRRLCAVDSPPVAPRSSSPVIPSDASDSDIVLPPVSCRGLPTVGRLLREKHRRALDAAVDRLGRRCRRGEAAAALQAIADERLAIPEASERTSLRVIARRLSVPLSCVCTWQRRLQQEAGRALAADGEFAVLRRAGGECRDGERRVDRELIGLLADARRERSARAGDAGRCGGQRLY